MSDASVHRAQAEECLQVAETLHEAGRPMWALVPLFYSAMHLMHARFDEDELSADMRHPELHRAIRDQHGDVKQWGTRDVINAQYESAISTLYRSLDTVGRMVRYNPPITVNTDRFWSEYDQLAAKCGARASARHDAV